MNLLNLVTLESRRLKICTSFAVKNSNSEKMNEFFIKNTNSHIMNTRNHEEYDIYFAHTERLKNSPILYMQRLLNEKCKAEK